jgi:thiol-disulfide isomerase/thioredoxin
MSRTESAMLALGTAAPDFTLPDVISGRTISLLKDFADKEVLLVMFICPHCPYVIHVQDEIAWIGKDYAAKSVGIVAISSNDVQTQPADSPDGMRAQAADLGFVFPYCYDESQDVARAYNAACTPEFYVFNRERKLVYRGQLDNSRRNTPTPVTGWNVRTAIDNTLAGLPVDPDQRPSIGCNIKWRLATAPQA